MSQTFAQFVPANSPRRPDGASGTITSAPHFNQTGDAAQPIFRLDIRRSLRIYRRLALGLALTGLALALVYLLNFWSIRTAQILNDLQPARYSNIQGSTLKRTTAVIPGPELHPTEEIAQYAWRVPLVGRQFQNSVRNGNGPRSFSLAAAAVTPWYSARSDVIRNALVLLLGFVFLGAAVAVVVHRADPRVYIASDVEQLLGFAPMAQLPDFSEVAREITDDHLLRLASGVDHAFRDRSFSHCVLTGAGPEVGVTTIATRLKKLLEIMGRAAVITDATGISISTRGDGQPELNRKGDRKPASLQLVNEADGTRGEIVLVDAPPLADSEETERLVRSADCTIVVIESGVTTRAQLRTVANILQRIKVPAVGFVLNRVRMATADPEFRRSIREMGKQLGKQGHATDLQMLQTLEQAIEEGRASLELDVAASSSQPAAKPPERITTHAPLFNKSFQIPSPLVEISSQFNKLPQPKTDCDGPSQAAPFEATVDQTENEPVNPLLEESTRVSLPRLSELRGMCFSQALRELDLARHPAPPSAGNEMLMSAIAPFEPMFTRTEPAQARNGDSPEMAHADPELPDALRAFIPVSRSEVSPQTENGVPANETSANGDLLHSKFFPPKPATSAKSKGRRGEDNQGSRPEHNVERQKPGSFLDQLQILPSRRGQYKKKS